MSPRWRRQALASGPFSVTVTDNLPAVAIARHTRQKEAVSTLLARTNEFTSAQELHARLRDAGERVGLTTVYSQLRTLAEAGEVDCVRNERGETLYRRCESGTHHHHLVCRRCGKAVEFDAPDVEAWARRVAARNGFVEAEHVVEISGVCASCAGTDEVRQGRTH